MAGWIRRRSRFREKGAPKGVTCTFRHPARNRLPGYLKVYNIKDIGEEDNGDEEARPLPPLVEECFAT